MTTWHTIDQLRKKHIRYAEMVFSRVYRNIRLLYIEEFKRVESIAEIEGSISRVNIDADITAAFMLVYEKVGVDFAKDQLKRWKSKHPNIQTKSDENIWREHMREFVRTRCAKKITLSIRSQYSDIERISKHIINRGQEAGWGAAQIAKEIVREQGTMHAWQALRIARTEVVGASNEGAFMGAKEAGIELVKTWIASPSGNFRQDHVDMENRPAISMDEYFVLPDGTQLQYPGDPDGPADQIINCRCAVAFEPLTSYDDLINQL
jgi:hypothetical protein